MPGAISKQSLRVQKNLYRGPDAEELAGGVLIHVFSNNTYVRHRFILCLHWSCAGLCGNKRCG